MNHSFKKIFAFVLCIIMLATSVPLAELGVSIKAHAAEIAYSTVKDHYLFAFFTGTSQDGQTIHLAVSEDGYHYTALRGNDPVIIPSKGVGCVRDPYIWYNEQDNYYYILATDLDFTDGGGTYSNNSQSFIVWRSKDLVHWYDETFIDVAAMSHLIGDTRNMTAVWAPQVLWDGEAYMVYFTLNCNATGNMSLVYLKTTDILDADAYYEYGVLFDPGYNVIDADIILNPADGKHYLFYKNEDREYDSEKADLKTIHYLVSENGPYGPYSDLGLDGGRGYRVYPGNTLNLEGCNSFFDNEGNLITYTDEYEHEDASGNAQAYFHISKTTDFKNFQFDAVTDHNINDLSPRHGSVVKISAEEYNRLIKNSYSISASSFPATENLQDHLVARYFTTSDPYYNAIEGKANLTTVSGVTMVKGDDAYYAQFNTGYAEVSLNSLFTKDLNYDDGFTITFSATIPTDAAYHTRIYEIADVFGTRTGTEHYTHFSPSGDANGAYIGNYNGPENSANDWFKTYHDLRMNDGQKHDYIISYANGNIIVYTDGELTMKKNRFTSVANTDSWYKAIGNATMRIGRSGWSENPDLTGSIQDLRLYNCSMSYYDVKKIQNDIDFNEGFGNPSDPYTGIASAVPVFNNVSVDSSLSGKAYSNLIYSPPVSGPTGESTNPEVQAGAMAHVIRGYKNDYNEPGTVILAQGNKKACAGVFYGDNTVLLYDGMNPAITTVGVNFRCAEENRLYAYGAYPTDGLGSTKDNAYFYVTNPWGGWWRTITADNLKQNLGAAVNNTSAQDGKIYNNSASATTSSYVSGSKDKQNMWFWSAMRVSDNIVNNQSFNDNGYLESKITWRMASDYVDGVAANSHSTYVIDFREIARIRNEIAAEYESIVSHKEYCPQAIATYVEIAKMISELNPHNYDYASNAADAVKKCADDINEAVTAYANAKASLKTCAELQITFPGRDATCTLNGLTEGAYCSSCGKIVKEQEIIPSLPHTFGTAFEENKNMYVQCSVCGFKTVQAGHEIRYENHFSLSEWVKKKNNTSSNGTVDVDLAKGTISFTNTAESGEAVTKTSGNVTRDFANYCMHVEGGKEYILEYFITSAGSNSDIFIFSYDKNGNCLNYGGQYSNAGSSNVHTYTFTTPEDAAYIELRFDSNNPGGTVVFANIGLYTKDSYTTYAKENPNTRLNFYTGDSIDLAIPKRTGFRFLGWYDSNGKEVTNTNERTTSVTVFAKWEELGYSVGYFGNLFSLTDFAKSEVSYAINPNVPDAYLYAEPEKGTFTTVSADYDIRIAGKTDAQHGDTYNVPGGYKIPVTAGKEYVFTFMVDIWRNTQCYMWFYNADGSQVNHPANATGGGWISHSTNKPDAGAVSTIRGTVLTMRFTVPEGATSLSVRMGSTTIFGYTKTFSNIGLYESADFDANLAYRGVPTMTYVPKNSSATLETPVKDYHEFDGWYTERNGAGTKFTSADTASMTANKIVYPNWKLTADVLTSDAYVLDFALKTQLDVLANDAIKTLNDGGTYSLAGLGLSSTGTFEKTLNGKYGTFTVIGDKVEYTPTKMINDISEEIFYSVIYTKNGVNQTVVSSLTVIPATVVYYEDDAGAVTYTNGVSADNSTGAWIVDGTSKTSSITQTLADDVYGYSDAYASDTSDFSMGAAHVVTVSAKNNPNATYSGSEGNSWPVAEFTFAGTGFDVVSLISRDTGAVRVVITDSSSKVCYNWLVDTYYGYKFENNDWVVSEASNALYQIPVIGKFDMPFDTYTVTIIPMYSTSLDHIKDGSYDFYLDAIRVYNPVADNMDAAMLYGQDNEYIMSHRPIRDILVDAGTLNPDDKNSVVYINPGIQEGTFEQYSKVGPKNETYLAKGQSVAFNITVNEIPASVQVSAHALNGSAAMRFASGASSSDAVNIAHKTTLYYAIPFMSDAYWIENSDGTYTTKAPIVITNNGDGILSLCNIKCTTQGNFTAPAMFTMSLDDFDVAASSAANIASMSPDDEGVFVPDESDVSAPENVGKGDAIELTLATSADVERVTVNGEDMTLVSVNNDGTKTWSYKIENAVTGEQSFTFVAYNADGIKSEETTVTVDVQSGIEKFFIKLKNFFMLIINFIKSLAVV